MSNPGDRWRRGWFIPVVLLALLGLVLARCATDNNSTGKASGSSQSAATPAAVGIDFDGKRVIVRGTVSREGRDALLAAVAAQFPGAEIVDRLDVVDGAGAAGGGDAALQAMRDVDAPWSVDFGPSGVVLRGLVGSEEIRSTIAAAVGAATGLPVDNQLQVIAPTEAPASEAVATESAATEPPATEPPATEAPATEPPTTEPPATEAPATEAPATEPAPSAEAVATAEAIAEEIKLTGVQFKSGSAELTTEAKGVLDKVAETLLANPGVRVEVDGHTDNSGDPKFNQTLSERRAAAVVAYLVTKGVAGDRLEARGFGPTKPIADNATAEGRTQNRRIEFVPIA